MSYIGKHYSNFQILASTSLEYKTIREYQNFIAFHHEVKQIVPSHDVNKNFKLLKHLKTNYPDLEIEIMENEACIPGCPNRMFHASINLDIHDEINNDFCLSGSYCTRFCMPVIDKQPFKSVTGTTHIFPWDIEEYSKTGINNFKFTGRDAYLGNFEGCLERFSIYLKGIDNIKNIQDYPLSCFTHHLSGSPVLNKLTVKEYKKYLPDIKHFVKFGHLCASMCGTECRYCYKCAEKIQKVFDKKQQEERKRTAPVCIKGGF